MIDFMTQCPAPSVFDSPIIRMCSRGSEPYGLLRQQLQIHFGDQSDFIATFDEALRKHPELKQELESANWNFQYAGLRIIQRDINTFYTAATKLQKIKTAEGETAAVISWLIDEPVFKQNETEKDWPTLIKPAIFGSLFMSRNEIVSISRPATTAVEDLELHIGMHVLYGDVNFSQSLKLREIYSKNLVRAIADQPEVVRMLARIKGFLKRHEETHQIHYSNKGAYLILQEKISDQPAIYHGFYVTNRWDALDPDKAETQFFANGKFEKVEKFGDVVYVRTETDLIKLNHNPFLTSIQGFNKLFRMFKPYMSNLRHLRPAAPSLPIDDLNKIDNSKENRVRLA
jgi:hypothetical protein